MSVNRTPRGGVTRKDLWGNDYMTPQLIELEKILLDCSCDDCMGCKKIVKCQEIWDIFCNEYGAKSINSPLEDMLTDFQKAGIL